MRLTTLRLTWRPTLQSRNASKDAWLPPHELRQPDQPLPVGHQPLTSWDTVPQPPQEESKWVPHPEMTPHKIDRGRQPHKEQEPQWAVSQKHQSQSQPRNEADPKKGRTEGKGKPSKIQVSIDWSTTGIQKPVSKPDSHPPSSKLDVSGPSVRSTVAKVSQKHASASRTRTSLSRTPNTQLSDPEKREIKDKLHRWIEARVKCLDLAGYMEEINSLCYFGRNAGCFALQIVAIANWGWKYMDVGFKYPILAFPQFLFTPLPESHQGRAQVPVKPSQVNTPGGVEKPGSGWWQCCNSGEMRHPAPTA